MRTPMAGAAIVWISALAFATGGVTSPGGVTAAGQDVPMFDTAHNCMACHNSLTTPAGEDISIGVAWRATMMANSARDPYWHAAVRREIIDHPEAAAEIEDECSVCHMPMARTQAVATGRRGQIFAHLPVGAVTTAEARLAADGVSCTACHQITAEGLGTPESWTGGYVIDPGSASPRPVFGPFAVDAGRSAMMHSATGFTPVESAHIRQSEVCATCHTLYTHARGPGGEVLGRFPEQVPYLEWRHSAYRDERSCQACHMPAVTGPARMSSVLGELREGVARHSFRGGNFFMLRMLNRYRTELGVEALPQELDAAVRDTLAHLAEESAALAIEHAVRADGRLIVDLSIANHAGHKLPTAYPSRRAWIHLLVRDAGGTIVFESGATMPDGSISGNDNDLDGRRFEPHHQVIERPDQVQIYEAIMADVSGAVTTGLLRAVSYLKDNRLLPRGFDKTTAAEDIAVHGAASGDPDFRAGGDRIRYRIDPGRATGPFRVEVELRFQPIAFRWARNLETYDADETRRFVRFYDSMAQASTATLARASVMVP
jgi:hypothetical protein